MHEKTDKMTKLTNDAEAALKKMNFLIENHGDNV